MTLTGVPLYNLCGCSEDCHDYNSCCEDIQSNRSAAVGNITYECVEAFNQYYMAVRTCPHDYTVLEIIDLCQTIIDQTSDSLPGGFIIMADSIRLLDTDDAEN